MTLEKAIELFLGEHIPTTRKSYFYVLKALSNFLGPARPITDLRAELLLEFSKYIRNKPGITSPATINKYVKTTRTFFNWCIKADLLTGKNPALALRYHRQHELIDRDRAMPHGDYLRLVDFAKWDARAYALVLFLGDGGGRIGGAAGLRWIDVDFINERAKVVEKGHPPRFVGFGEECGRALTAWQMNQKRTLGEYVFSGDGRHMGADSLGQYFSRVCTRAGIKPWGPHSLRHRKGYQMSDAGVQPQIAAEVLGDTVEITLKYYYPKDWQRVKTVVDQLGFKPQQQPEFEITSKTGTK